MKNLPLVVAGLAVALLLAGTSGCASKGAMAKRTKPTLIKRSTEPLRVGMTKSDATKSMNMDDDEAQQLREVAMSGPDWTGSRQSEPSPAKSMQSKNPQRTGRPVGLFGEGIEVSDPRQPAGQGNLVQVSFISEGQSFDPAIDSAGKRIAFASTMHQSGSNLYIKTIGGSTVTQLTSDPADDVMPCFNPGGDRITFTSNRAGKWDIYVMSVNGGPPMQLTNDNDHEIHPTWSPDGRYIAYCKLNSQSNRWEIWTADVENPGVRRFLDYGMFPKWSPDVASSKILFQRPRQRGSRLHGIWTLDYVNGEAMHPTEIVSAANAAAINPSWSPDGQRIVFVTVVDPEKSSSDVPEQSDLWVVNLDGSGRVRLTDGQFSNFQPVWSSGGPIYFISNRSGTDNIWAVATDRVIDMSPGAAGIASVPTNRD